MGAGSRKTDLAGKKKKGIFSIKEGKVAGSLEVTEWVWRRKKLGEGKKLELGS